MKLGLGIDTGGTYTDAVIVDLESNRVIAKAKSPTTYQDLAIGITGALDGVLAQGGFSKEDVSLVGLSTTLATNSILQGRGGEVGLIGIGWRPEKDWDLGCKKSRFIKGGFDSIGRTVEPLDKEELKDAIREVSQGVDAMVVSCIFGVYNSWQESEAADMIREMTVLPVVMGHTLTGELGIKERTVTATLNAKLLPIINDFLASVKSSLMNRGIQARILVFKGDGGLMTIETAMQRPVETILSGPAASLMGGKVLAGLDTCILIDVGGTSTDIAYLDDGFPRINFDGAMVGHWRTRVKALDMWTCGLGGDSAVRMGANGDLTIGPDRVVPLAIAASMRKDLKLAMLADGETTFYVAGKGNLRNLSQSESIVYDYIAREGPRSLFETMDGVKDVVLIKDTLMALMARGNMLCTGLTPTDIMHLNGDFVVGDKEASQIGLQLLAAKMDDTPENLAKRIMERVVTRVGEEVLIKTMADEAGLMASSQAADKMLHAAAGERVFAHMALKASLDRPLIGVGAPAMIVVKPLEDRMDAKVIIPPHFDVGNAVGAVCSLISESITVEVYPRDDKFIVFTQFGSPSEYRRLEEALQSARSTAERYVREKLETSRAEDIKVKIDRIDRKFSDGYGKEMKFISSILVRATATGRPLLEK
ncbi:MAG: hydantoinase/oxoprolinase family protein [Methanomassiliicoccales archaeon]|nr:hydantoinase/oxoprolinase family protein [Methanomassiliicoccales archaeon]